MTRISAAYGSRAGVTLVELLVVCMIISILATMAFPAISGAVARSRLTVCANNQNQLGYAILRFEERYGCLPGWLANDIPVRTGTSFVGTWAVQVLPFIGRTDIFDDIFDKAALPSQLEVNTFSCPSNTTRSGSCILHYAANVGATGTVASDGVFLNALVVPTLSLEAIAEMDGTTTTLAFAEKASLDVVAPHRWTFNSTSSALFGAGAEPMVNLPPVFGVNPTVSATTPVINNPALKHFAPTSNHMGGVSVVFCDGHTAFLSDKLPHYVYAQLLTPRTRWSGTAALTNSSAMQPWLLKSGSAYVLDVKDLRQ